MVPAVVNIAWRTSPFVPNVRSVVRSISNPRCKIEIWTWGVFDVKVSVEDKQGRTFTMSHYLEYVSHLNEPGMEFKSS